jgi:hypothetical protein
MIGFLTHSLPGIEFFLSGPLLQPKIGKNKSRVKAVKELMTATTPQARAAALNKLLDSYWM